MYTWPYPPNWGETFKATYRFKTEVISSFGGKEQRIAGRFEPRVELEFDGIALPREFQAVQRTLHERQNEEIVMPFWARYVRTTSQINSGSVSFDVPEVKPWMVAGAHMCFTHGREAESVKIASSSGTTITLESGVTKDWPVRTKLCEGFPGHLDDRLRQTLRTDRVGELTIGFQATPGATPAPGLSGAQLTLDSLDIFDFPINWGDTPRFDHEVFRETVDYGYGVYEHQKPIPFPTATREMRVHRFSSEELLRLEQFFRRCRGSQKEFYATSQIEDFTASGQLSSGSTDLILSGVDAASYLQNNVINRAVHVRTRYGNLYRQITGVVASGSETIVTLRNPWTTTIALADIKRVSVLNVVRFASDAMTIEWTTPEVGNAKISLQTLEDQWSAV